MRKTKTHIRNPIQTKGAFTEAWQIGLALCGQVMHKDDTGTVDCKNCLRKQRKQEREAKVDSVNSKHPLPLVELEQLEREARQLLGDDDA